MKEVLRDYQQDMLSRLEKAWKRYRSVMVQMPTGTGKTHLMAEVIKNLSVENSELSSVASRIRIKNYDTGGVLVVAHRRELIEQISQTLDDFSVEHGLIVSGKTIDDAKRVQVASIQTLAKRLNHTKLAFEFSLIIIDEAHHALAKTYRMLWERWPKAKFLGLTATPCRLSGEPFTDLFETILQSYSIQEFIDKGFLSDFDYVSARPDSEVLQLVRTLKKRGANGDYQQKELATVMDVPESIEHLYKTYRQFANGKKGIVYAIDRQHAAHITEYYQAQGVNCWVIDAKTPAEERKRIIEEYKESTPLAHPCMNGQEGGAVLVNVDVFSEGFDCPEVEFIQLARPTLSLSKYLQQVGRGMRVSLGKPHVLILDNVGLYQSFGLPTVERDWRQTFYGLANGKGTTDGSRMVVVDESDYKSYSAVERELVNLQMVRIKKGGKRGTGLEVFIKDGRYGIRNNGRISCPARFKEIVRLNDQSGYFAAGVYGGKLYGDYVEYATLIDRKGIDLNLRLFREVKWKGGYFYSYYKRPGYKKGDDFWSTYWDPKGNCYYDFDPGFRILAGVEVAEASEHFNNETVCLKLRCSTGNVSPRFHFNEVFYNRQVVVARNYLIVKKDHNHAYQICAFLNDSVLVRQESDWGYQQIFMDGRKGERFRNIPPDAKRSILQVQYLGLKRI